MTPEKLRDVAEQADLLADRLRMLWNIDRDDDALYAAAEALRMAVVMLERVIAEAPECDSKR